MRYLFMLFITLLSLHANAFYANNPQKEAGEKTKIRKAFRESVSDANAILKRGEYNKILKYKSDILSIIEQLNLLNIPEENKQEIHDDMVLYSELINDISAKLQEKAPMLQERDQTVIEGLDGFNKKISAIGLSELSQNWYKLSSIKNNFIKNPSTKLEQEFTARLSVITTIITELYLDEEQEEALFWYLKEYKNYFQDLSSAYSMAEYKNLKKVKPLSYKIKAQLELFAPYN